MKSLIMVALALLALSTQVVAGEVKISDVWSRATAPGQEVGMVGMIITSNKNAKLIAVSSTASTTSEIHSMSMDNGVMKMRQIENLPLAAKQAAELGPGGNHLMLIGLKKPLKEGNKVALTLTVEFDDKSTETINTSAIVKGMTAGNGMHHH
jgi:hypothetical protein